MSSSTWWDQTSILLLPSLIWLTRLFHHYHHNHDQNHIGDLIQVDNLLWDSEEGEGRQFRRGLFIVIILTSERSSFVTMRHFFSAEELNSQSNQLFFRETKYEQLWRRHYFELKLIVKVTGLEFSSSQITHQRGGGELRKLPKPIGPEKLLIGARAKIKSKLNTTKSWTSVIEYGHLLSCALTARTLLLFHYIESFDLDCTAWFRVLHCTGEDDT